MKILHIINSLNTGGAEKLVIDTLPLFNKKGVQVDLALLKGGDTPFYHKLRKNISENVKIYEFTEGSVYNPLHIFRIIPFFKRYDVIHAHLFPIQYFLVLAKILSFSKTKLIFTEHSTRNRRLQNPKFRKIERFIYNHYSKIICITEEVKNELRRCLNIPENKLKVIQNGIDISKIKKQNPYKREEFGFSHLDKLLIMVAGFRREKDQDTLVKCMGILPENYKLILVGDGERRNIIEKIIKEEKLQERVLLLGIRNDVISLIKMCDIAVLSSHWEGLPVSILEKMASGLPIIGSDVKGINQIIEERKQLFEKGNVEELKNRILSLEDKNLYYSMSQKGIEKSEEYDINKMVDDTIDLYKQII